jgi:hypothetical protein
MTDHQSRRSLLSRLPPENSDVRDDTDELVGGKTRLVPRKGSVSSSRAGTESLPASSPRELPTTLRTNIHSMQDSVELSPHSDINVDASMDSPMTVWQNNWGHIQASQQTPNFQYPTLPMQDNGQYIDRIPSQWYNGPQSFQASYQQQPQLISTNDRQHMSFPPNHNMFESREISSFSDGAMSYPQQQPSPPNYPSPPTNDAHADWQHFLNQTLQGY